MKSPCSWSICILLCVCLGSPAQGQPCCQTAPGMGRGQDSVTVLQNDNSGSDPAEAEDPAPPDDQDEDGKQAQAREEWDVQHPPWTLHDVVIDTAEGTWMNVDVSPDGRSIAFDLLGDIYEMPITGGEAAALTSGVAWDMQPRYSPDGQHIAFTSDRGGGDNIWVMRRDGSEARAVTRENFRLLNSPAWTPDGRYIAARKHFTSRRSLGAGEIWLYHHSGGEGLQMTERPNDQKDVGEPAFSPDGRYLYYSQDVTPGKVFEYSKDPNGEIYAIQRLDRQRQETQRWIQGAGGSIRPTPSPDGTLIAFVRRVRYRSMLYLQDVRSGREWPIYDDLERDMQETWAIHGVYPSMAWTPDSRGIVFYARGKIRRIDIDSKAVTEIPFHVRDTRQVATALRFPVEVAPPRFPVRVLRWVQVSPTGNAVVYQALGHLYVRSLPDGTPRRLTTQEDHFEFYPSFSRDGRFIVYTTWNDDTLGSVRIVPAGGGEGRVVTQEPGHYIEPVFTPEGDAVVFRRVDGGGLRSRLWSHATGIFVAPAEGGPARLITRDGGQPQFGADGGRVYLTRSSGEGDKDRRTLFSIDLHGSHERTEVNSENATEFRLSPDGAWLAFTERFNAYIIPFAPSGRPIDIGPKMKSIPVRQVSRDAGEYLHFSGDGRKLHWAHHHELFTRELNEAFDFLPGSPEELPPPLETGLDISFDVPTDVPDGQIALAGGRIITLRGDEVIDDGVVLVEGNRIRGVGPRSAITVPAGAHVVDATGCTIIPGLIDVHDHGAHGGDGIIPQRNWVLYAKLAFGVTTVHDPSHDTKTIFASSELARAGLITAPRIFSTGTILYGAQAPFKAEIETLDDARSHLRRLRRSGAFSVKSYNQPRRDQRQKVIAAAGELGMMVVPEGGSLLQHNLTMIVDGHTGIEHALPVERVYQDILMLWAASATGYTPTLMVAYGGLWGEHYWYQHTNAWEHPRLSRFMPRSELDPRSRRRTMVPDDELNHIRSAEVCKRLLDAGVKVNLGAHGQLPGLGHHWELWMMAQGGMTPLEVLRAGTLNPAQYLGLDGDIGSLEAGKLADLLVLDADPLADIRNTGRIRYTMINGRLYDAATMNEAGNHPRARGPFFFQDDIDPGR